MLQTEKAHEHAGPQDGKRHGSPPARRRSAAPAVTKGEFPEEEDPPYREERCRQHHPAARDDRAAANRLADSVFQAGRDTAFAVEDMEVEKEVRVEKRGD